MVMFLFFHISARLPLRFQKEDQQRVAYLYPVKKHILRGIQPNIADFFEDIFKRF